MTFTLETGAKKPFTGAVFLVMRLVFIHKQQHQHINNAHCRNASGVEGFKEDFIADRGIELMGESFDNGDLI
ncbi:MAG: hypothetical protein ACLR31_02635 [Escherichia coli]